MASEVEISSETLRVDTRSFYADLRANARGSYVRLSERVGRAAAAAAADDSSGADTAAAAAAAAPDGPAAALIGTASTTPASSVRNSVCLPGIALSWFAAILEYFVSYAPASSRELPVENKIFYFELGDHPQKGTFLRLSENGAGPRGRSSLTIPAGGPPPHAPAWAALRDVLLRAQAAAFEYHWASGLAAAGVPPPPPPTATADPRLVAAIAGPSPVVGPGPAPPTIAPTPSGGCLVRAGHKRFFFDAGANAKGGYLRVSEVAGSDRTSIIIPAWALPQCVAAAGAFLGPLCGPGGAPAAAAAGGALAAAGGVGVQQQQQAQQVQQQQQQHVHAAAGGWGDGGVTVGLPALAYPTAGGGGGGGGGAPPPHHHHLTPPRRLSPPALPPLDALSLAPGGPTAARAAAAAMAANHRAAAVAAAAAAMAAPPPAAATLPRKARAAVVVAAAGDGAETPPTPAAVDEESPAAAAAGGDDDAVVASDGDIHPKRDNK